MGPTGSDPEAGPRCATSAAAGFHRRRPKQWRGSPDFAGNRAQGVIWPGTWRVRTRRRSRAAWCGRLDAGVTGTASATSGGGGGVRDLVGIGVAVRVLANEGAGRGLRRSRSSSELLARAEELGGEPYDGNGGRRSSACERASYGGGGDARGEGKGGRRSSPWGHTVARWVTRSSRDGAGDEEGRRRPETWTKGIRRFGGEGESSVRRVQRAPAPMATRG